YLEDFVKRGELVGITPGKWDAVVAKEQLRIQGGNPFEEPGTVVNTEEGQRLPAQREGLRIEGEGMIAQGEGLIQEGEALVAQAEGFRVQAEGLIIHGEGLIAHGQLIIGTVVGVNEQPDLSEE
ncbi:hypothetical protein V491_03171, partial [Pseudogymnoascus sp. VKM F-3775]